MNLEVPVGDTVVRVKIRGIAHLVEDPTISRFPISYRACIVWHRRVGIRLRIVCTMAPSSSRTTTTTTPTSLDALLPFVQRRFRGTPGREPLPSAAAAALGRSLCAAWLLDHAQQQQQQHPPHNDSATSSTSDNDGNGTTTTMPTALLIQQRLSDPSIHPSIALAFLDGLLPSKVLASPGDVQKPTSVATTTLQTTRRMLQFLSQWVSLLEEANNTTNEPSRPLRLLLDTCLPVLAHWHALLPILDPERGDTHSKTTAGGSDGIIVESYTRLLLPSSRQTFTQSMVRASLSDATIQSQWRRRNQTEKSLVASSSPSDKEERIRTEGSFFQCVVRRVWSPLCAAAFWGTTPDTNTMMDSATPLLWWVWALLRRTVNSHWSSSRFTASEDRLYWMHWSMRLMDLFRAKTIVAASSAPVLAASPHNSHLLLLEQMWLDWIEWVQQHLVALISSVSETTTTTKGKQTVPLKNVTESVHVQTTALLSLVLELYLPRAWDSGLLLQHATVVLQGVSNWRFPSCSKAIFASPQQNQCAAADILSPIAQLRWSVALLTGAPTTETRISLVSLLFSGQERKPARSPSPPVSSPYRRQPSPKPLVLSPASNHPQAADRFNKRTTWLSNVATILVPMDPYCREVIDAIFPLDNTYSLTLQQDTAATELNYRNAMELFGMNYDSAKETMDTGGDGMFLRRMISSLSDLTGSQLSTRQLTAALLFGVSLLDDQGSSSYYKDRFSFLKSLIAAYPDVAVSLLSLVIDRIDRASHHVDQAATMLSYMEFMCETLAGNPHCAQEIWSLVTIQWMNPHAPLTLRIASVRLFPQLVASNKRLYRRVIDSIGALLGGSESAVRLAAAVSLADLAKDDLIRDVTDVIGWIQTLLTVGSPDLPAQALLIHYAIMTLYYLVIAGELDFDVVIKVLNKKLCSIGDFRAICKLPLVVIEALVLLLGVGECGGDSDDGHDDAEKPAMASVSPQVNAAVSTLLHITRATQDLPVTGEEDIDTVVRIRGNVFVSLAKYSLQALSVDEDSINFAIAAAGDDDSPASNEKMNNYGILRDLVVAEMKVLVVDDENMLKTNGLLALVTKLVEFEEEVLGSQLWQKRGRPLPKSDKSKETGSKEDTSLHFKIRSILPQTSKLQESFDESPTFATAIALLLSSDGTKLSVLRDLADSSLDVVDPLFLLLCVQGYLHTISRLMSVKPQSTRSMISEVKSWYEIFVSPDAMYLALSCFSMFLSDDDDTDNEFSEDVFETVMNAYKRSLFENSDVAKICVGMMGVSSLRCGGLERIDDVVSQLEQSVRGYGGEQSFGAYFGLALIAQAGPKFLRPDAEYQIPSKEIVQIICRINGFVFEELAGCYFNGSDSAGDVLASIKLGKVSSTLVDTILNFRQDTTPVLPAKQRTAQFLFLSCAVCFPSLASVNSYLLLAVFRFLESLPWGSGKSFAFPSVIRCCQKTNMMNEELLSLVCNDFVVSFNKRFAANDDDPGIDDILFALKAVRWSVFTDGTSNLPPVGHSVRSDNDGAKLLVASVMSIASISCFGTAQLDSLCHLEDDVSSDDINSVVEVMLEAIASKIDTPCSSMGTILLGLLSAIGDSEIPEDELSQKCTTQQKIHQLDIDRATAKSHETSVPLDFGKLPTPQAGTVLHGIGRIIERYCLTALTNQKHDMILSRALHSLERLSIPDKYAKALIEPLLRQNIARDSSIALLCSQVGMRRRAYSDGHSFVVLITQMCSASNDDWIRWVGRGKTAVSFVRKLSHVGRKLSAESFLECLSCLWEKCFVDVNSFDADMICTFLAAAKSLLTSTALSPKSMHLLRDFTRGRLFDDIRRLPTSSLTATLNNGYSALQMFVQSLKEVPLSILDDGSCFILSTEYLREFENEAVRALVVLELVSQNYFDVEQRHTSELSNVACWFSRNILALSGTKHKSLIRRVACAFSCCSMKETMASKHERLTMILDVLLLTDISNCAKVLEWFAAVLATWQGGQDHQGDLSLGFLVSLEPKMAQTLSTDDLDHYFRIVVNNLPSNLTSFTDREGKAVSVLNLLVRVYNFWIDIVVDDHSLRYVHDSILSCHTSHDAFVGLASSVLRDTCR